MGWIISLVCPSCGYRNNNLLAGWGFEVRYEIMLCRSCEDLVSVLVELNPNLSLEGQEESRSLLNQCPTCHQQELIEIQEPYTCPRCQAGLVNGPGGFWD